jgi:hypothetical protein
MVSSAVSASASAPWATIIPSDAAIASEVWLSFIKTLPLCQTVVAIFPLDSFQKINTYTFTDFLKYGAGIQRQI